MGFEKRHIVGNDPFHTLFFRASKKCIVQVGTLPIHRGNIGAAVKICLHTAFRYLSRLRRRFSLLKSRLCKQASRNPLLAAIETAW
ncbi:MAG TPA: hypothetical protein VN692_20445 [Steroidobacteraceae bacterium]|nr:hypothetical protein [Steroidobacteraceae bacterium]